MSEDSVNSSDSIQIADDIIRTQIIKQGNKNSSFFNYSFKNLAEYLNIISSKDKLLRIYTWDTWTGGTGHYYYAVAQFLGEDKNVHTQLICDTTGSDSGLSYSEIYTCNIKGRQYYLSIGDGKYSTRDLGQTIIVYTIKGNHLVQAPIIKTQKGLTNSIHIGYDLSNLNGKKDHLIAFNETTNELKTPVVNPEGKILNKDIIYKLKGEYFERIGIK